MSQICSNLPKLVAELEACQDCKQARVLQRFFKTGKGEYGEGDLFWGLRVSQIRAIAKHYLGLSLEDLGILLASAVHEKRACAVIIMVGQYQKADLPAKQKIYDFYLAHTHWINNWDLVDISAPHIVGEHLVKKLADPKMLFRLVKSKLLWERRIAMLATFAFIKQGQYKLTLDLAELLLNDPHDLMHKATGWMLREMGKRQEDLLLDFLDQYAAQMPRVMLRYAIEKLPQEVRQGYLGKKSVGS
ncbi:MAG TPA: DNA alkylation repair protein [Candidatus Wirthbacteria bacterium]|nr:DNA alkylation repair protein [Candidatus Wirthbacteria bacterium]